MMANLRGSARDLLLGIRAFRRHYWKPSPDGVLRAYAEKQAERFRVLQLPPMPPEAEKMIAEGLRQRGIVAECARMDADEFRSVAPSPQSPGGLKRDRIPPSSLRRMTTQEAISDNSRS